ncbi:hypothetical protein EUGRSUZ_K01649 [Eucalyptus grandis]|uniref:non-specific serine/threonine protein kinase n=3 Tax=Eucalyptus grandis TaxID=71139 RepID=A0A059A293_EUCGR|nr:hypothetical protein EUGRSUZ_K01649 [Eucalyptus grandis]KAK3405380.1 hypothetical protein EUGRSUZ_K01649 [Eucalyptus grandis]
MGPGHGMLIETQQTQSRLTANSLQQTTHEGGECEIGLDKNFGFSNQFLAQYEMGKEIGGGGFGCTYSAKAKEGSLKGQEVAVKVLPKSKMTAATDIDDVRREVQILRALNERIQHQNIIQFCDAYEDEGNVYIVMELCQGRELFHRISSRGGNYSEEDAKAVMVQILSAVAFCHLQGVIHRDLKPENFLFATADENSPLKLIDFGLSAYINPGGRLKDLVGSKFTVAPDVLHASYGTEADMWSIGVIAYLLLCGAPPFWGQNQSEIFQVIRKKEPSFDEDSWPSRSPEAIDFVKRLLNKNYRGRLTAAQALCHPWLVSHHDVKIPLDMMVCRLVIAYIRSSPRQKEALQTLAKTLTEAQLAYLRKQFALLRPKRNGLISMQDFQKAVTKKSTEAMKHSGTLDYANEVSNLAYGAKFDFQEFCAAAISADQLAGTASLEEYAREAFKHFPREERRVGTSQRQTTFNEFIKLLHDHSQTI